MVCFVLTYCSIVIVVAFAWFGIWLFWVELPIDVCVFGCLFVITLLYLTFVDWLCVSVVPVDVVFVNVVLI